MPEIKQEVSLDYLFDELCKKLQEYEESLKRDKIFEIRRNILREIRELEKQIALLKQKET